MLVVPLSVLITVLLLSALGMSFNIMTLGGVAAAIGLLIDDVIVMIEHIARRAGAPGVEQPNATVLPAAREFFSPLLGSSLATIIIFLPLAALSGVTGAFFKFLALTMVSALVISYLLTAFTVPLLARGIIDFERWKDPAHGRETWLRRTHGRLLRDLFAYPWIVAIAAVVLGSVEIWDSPKQDIVIQAWDGPICADRRPVGENGTALPREEVGPRSQRFG